jgi:hypothetical protein
LSRPLTTDEFATRSRQVHGDLYDYSLAIYMDSLTKIKVICKQHGIFEQKPHDHMSGKGCRRCATITCFEDFLGLAYKIHGDFYCYSEVKFKSSKKKVKINCPKHGYFLQTPYFHARGHRCPKCANDIISMKKMGSGESFIERAKIVHNSQFDYSLVNYLGNNKKVEIICKDHGTFLQTPNNHLSGNSCPKCNESSGEKRIARILDNFNISYIRQYSNETLRNIHKLRFDFCVFIDNSPNLIEFQGRQHYEPYNFGSRKDPKELFEIVKKNDLLKKEWCIKNNIPLLEIPYWDFDRVEELLTKFLPIKDIPC